MNFRFRLLAALFALMALLLFQVEGLWASQCSPEMEMPVASQVVDAGSDAPACPMGESGHPHEQDERQGTDGPSCPLMPAGAATCVGGIALLPSAAAPALAATADLPALASADHAKDLLLAASLLRPPRA